MPAWKNCNRNEELGKAGLVDEKEDAALAAEIESVSNRMKRLKGAASRTGIEGKAGGGIPGLSDGARE